METFFRKHSNVMTLTMLLVVQMLGLAVQVKRETDTGAPSNLLHVWAIRLIAPIEKGFVHTEASVHDVLRHYIFLRGVRRENEDLKRQLDAIRVNNVRLQEDALQARRIQTILGFKEQFIHKTIAAQVIGTSGSDKSCIIYIDRGSDDGVKPNMAVVTPDGIIGKVLHVQATTSQVLEINDQTSGVGALLVKSRLQGVVKGTPAGDVVLNNIMADEKVEVGEVVTTSGGDQIFPKGLTIGTVTAANPGRDIFLNIRIKPAANLNRLEEVLVVTEILTQEPDTRDLGPIRAADILAARLPSVPQPTTPPADGTAVAPGTATSGTTVPTKSTNQNTSTPPNTTTQPSPKNPSLPSASSAVKDSFEKKKSTPKKSPPESAPANPTPQDHRP